MQKLFAKITSAILSFVMLVMPWANVPKATVDKDSFKTTYTNVFVHGLGGWGAYDIYYDMFPYWGVRGGDLMKYLNARGFNCAAASVNEGASAWDRACELYAQLTGTRVDYGKEHSERCHHRRYGQSYVGRPLIKRFSATDKINLLGHSFGGATVLMFLQLMHAGSEAERAATPENELSDFFKGGKGDWVLAVVALAAPMNGTTAYSVRDEIREDPNATAEERAVVAVLSQLSPLRDGRIEDDSAMYDMYIDNAMEMCEGFETLPDVYYFSLPCSKVVQNEDGTWSPKEDEMEPLFRAASKRIGSYTGVTPKGYVIDERWQKNDGLVNTISATAPFNAPKTDFDRTKDTPAPGVWNVMPDFDGDHMSLEGGLLVTTNIRPLYVDMLTMLNRCA